jgi:TonB-linked SusC/RagA family outer membrane protein
MNRFIVKIEKMKRRWAIIYLLLPMIFLSVGLNAQDLTIKGKVLDTDGNSLPGAAIVVKGATIGTASNDAGDYTLPNVPKGSILEVRLVGFVTQEVKVADKTDINILLLEEATSLDDVTIVAFSTQKKESVMASIATVKPSELKVPSSNLTTAFAGRIAGLISYQRSGEPGQDNAEFFIRGVTSFGIGKKDPLILIDGVEMTTDDLARLTTDDINSFSVMKDANATALYGARGANGVIMVTTKEGREGKAKIQFRSEISRSAPTRMIDVADPLTYMKLNNEAIRTRNLSDIGGGGNVIFYPQEEIWARERGLDPLRYPMVDWTNMLFNDHVVNHRYNLNVSGGGNVVRYYVAAAFNRDNGIINMDERNNFNNNIAINKYALRSNININLSKTTEMIARLNAAFDDYSGPLDGGDKLFEKARNANPVLFLPYYPADDANQLSKHILFGNSLNNRVEGKWHLNPYADMVKGYKNMYRSSMSSQFELKQDFKFITEGLTARALFSINRYSSLEGQRAYDPKYYGINTYYYDNYRDDSGNPMYMLNFLNEDSNPDSFLKQIKTTPNVDQTLYFETAVQYNREFAKKHAVSGLLVFQLRDYENTGAATQDNVQLALPKRNVGLSGRATYGYDSRYFFEFNFGYNGSERFAAKERFGFFPSVGVGYLISNEQFMEPLRKVLTLLKLKATYGSVGNDQIGSDDDRFYYLSDINMNVDGKTYRSYRFGEKSLTGAPGSSIEFKRYADPYITWEISRKANFGIELKLWNSLELQVDYALERRSNILQTRVIPSTAGMAGDTPKANIGESSGKAFEVMVDYSKSFGKDLWAVFRGTFTYASSKYEVFEEMSHAGSPRRSHIGQSVTQRYGYIAERLFIDDDEVANSPGQTSLGGAMAGDLKYKDINGDYQIDQNDKVPIGYPFTPEINYGFGLSLGYKNVDFSCFFSGSARSSFWIDAAATTPFNNSVVDGVTVSRAMLQVYADDYWNESTRNIYALWPRLSANPVGNNGGGDAKGTDGSGQSDVLNTWFMRNGNFLRLKTMELGYTFPKKWVNTIKLQNIRLYASGTNLFVISKFKMWDPEQGSSGLGYPVQRVFNLGLNIEF